MVLTEDIKKLQSETLNLNSEIEKQKNLVANKDK